MTIQIIVPDWPAPPGIAAGTTTREGGVSADRFASLNLGEHVGDDAGNVLQNRRRLVAAAGLPAEPVWLRQTHSVNVAVDAPLSKESETDALVTEKVGQVAVIMTADCLPVLFAAADGSEVAAAHAGWRGLSAGILEKTVASMTTPVNAILVWLGPAISQPAFEVGEEVMAQFVSHSDKAGQHFRANARGRFQADLCGLAKQRLEDMGITQVFGGGFCTFAEPHRFFSYRRDGQCGRHATFIYRRSSA